MPFALHIPQPCQESWADMSPTSVGRHCAACQKVVVDFTQKTDAEMLAYFQRAGGNTGCGRFRVGQVGRPLATATPSGSRWRLWLAAVVAAWSLRPGSQAAAKAAPAPTQLAPTTGKPAAAQVLAAADSVLITGVVRDSTTRESLPGVTVALQGTAWVTLTNVNGQFRLKLAARDWQQAGHTLRVSYVGYHGQLMQLPLTNPSPAPLEVVLAADKEALGEMIMIGGYVAARKPWPWHPRRLYQWSRYWVTRPFRQ